MGWFSPDMQTMQDLFLHSMQDIYYAEHQIEKALPDMVSKATDAELKKGFQTHLKQTKGQIKRLNQVFKKLKVRPQRDQMPGDRRHYRRSERDRRRGRRQDGAQCGADRGGSSRRALGTMVAWARLLGHSDVARVLNLNLKEEKATDKKLNGIAKRKINRKAAARQRKRPGRLERTQDALMEAAAGIPAV
jgi:ferritin-like metal-binding protein YciE